MRLKLIIFYLKMALQSFLYIMRNDCSTKSTREISSPPTKCRSVIINRVKRERRDIRSQTGVHVMFTFSVAFKLNLFVGSLHVPVSSCLVRDTGYSLRCRCHIIFHRATITHRDCFSKSFRSLNDAKRHGVAAHYEYELCT